MIPNNDLPDVGTPEEALEKMKDSYKALLDSIAKFVTISGYYIIDSNDNTDLPTDFLERYNTNFQKLKGESAEEIYEDIATFTMLDLLDVEEIRDDIQRYDDLLKNGPDKTASSYDQACDYLSVKDAFNEHIELLNQVSGWAIEDKGITTHFNDVDYDPAAKQVEENKSTD